SGHGSRLSEVGEAAFEAVRAGGATAEGGDAEAPEPAAGDRGEREGADQEHPGDREQLGQAGTGRGRVDEVADRGVG
ncbi:hypothetical protein, partial [Mycobacterium tuberculosis]